MEDTVKLGIVGFGRIVELIHLPMLKRLPQIEVGGVFDATPQRLSLAAKRGFFTYSELEEMLSSPIDAILIATPPNSHYQLAEQALRKGKHVIIEKPVALDYQEALQLKKIADQEGKIVTVFHNRRFDNDYLFVKRIIEQGTLGPILFVERRHHMFGSGASFGVKSFHQQWRNEKSYGGGALLDWGVHLIDQLLQLRLGNVMGVHGIMKNLRWQQGEVDDYVHAVLGTDSSIPMSIDINFGSNVSSPLWIVGGEKVTLQVVSSSEAFLFEKGRELHNFKIEPAIDEGPYLIYSSFVDAIKYGGRLEVTLEEAIETMRIIDSIRELAMESKEV
jgi:scyllo-inositol 2-dehydrogenase (NADP+)